MDVSRRQFFKICAGGMAGTTVAALGFAPKQALAQARNYKLLRAKEIRNTCTYCSVGCGLLMYSLGDGAKNAREAIYHIEGDPDHPVSRGALCPKGAGLLDYVNSAKAEYFCGALCCQKSIISSAVNPNRRAWLDKAR